MRRALRSALVVTVGGAAASLAMDVVQTGIAAVLERDRLVDVDDEEVEAIAAVVRLLGAFAPALERGAAARATARALHYAFGIGFAFAYVAAVRRYTWLAAARGIAFGAGLFVLSDRILIPTLKLGRSWDRYSRSERLNAFASHVAYGVVLEAVRAGYANDIGDAR